MLAFSHGAAERIKRLEPDVISAYNRFSAYFSSHEEHPTTFTTENYDALRYHQPSAVHHHPLNRILHPWKPSLDEGGPSNK